MMSFGEVAISYFDIVRRSVPIDAQQLVVVQTGESAEVTE